MNFGSKERTQIITLWENFLIGGKGWQFVLVDLPHESNRYIPFESGFLYRWIHWHYHIAIYQLSHCDKKLYIKRI